MSWKDTITEEKPEKVASNWRDTVTEVAEAPATGFLQETLSAIDSVTGAPTRAAVGAVVDGENPFSAFADQFGGDPELAPTGKDIATKMGVSTKPRKELLPELDDMDYMREPFPAMARGMDEATREVSPAGMTGLAIDVAADWTNLLGPGLLKGGAKAADEALALARKGAAATVKGGAKAVGKTAAAATDLATGSKTGTEAYKSVANLLSPKVADDFGRMKDIALRNEIDPETLSAAVEFGPNSIISRGERSIAEGPTGEKILNRFEEGTNQIRKAIDRRFKKAGGGKLMDDVEAGQHIRDSFERGVDKFFSGIDWTHNGVVKTLDDMGMADIPVSLKQQEKIASKLDEVEEFALKEIDAAISPAEKPAFEGLLNAVNGVRSRDGSYKSLLDIQRRIGRQAFAPGKPGIPAPDKKKLADLYFALDEALIDSTEKSLGKEVAASLKQNNRLMSEFFGQKGVLTPIVEDLKQSPEKVFQSLVKNGDSRKLEALKKVLPPEDVQALKGAFLESLIKRDPNGDFSIDRLRTALQNKKFVAKSLFDPEELDQINELLELAERMGSPILSSSGTGASNSFRELVKGISDSVSSRVILDNMRDAARSGNPVSVEPLQIPLIGPIPSAVSPSTPRLANAPVLSSPALLGAEAGLRAATKPASLATTDQVNTGRDEQAAQAGYLGTMRQGPPPPETNIQRAKRLNQMNQGL